MWREREREKKESESERVMSDWDYRGEISCTSLVCPATGIMILSDNTIISPLLKAAGQEKR